jgi:hypothetical protein
MAVVPTPPLSNVTTAPQRNAPTETFNDDADAFAASLSPFGLSVQAIGKSAEDNAKAAEAAALTTGEDLDASQLARNQAEQFALTAVNAPGTSATSTTTMALGVGTKSPTIQTGKAIRQGQYGTFSVSGDGAKAMDGRVLTYDPATGAMTFDARNAEGSGSYSNWVFALSAPGALPAATKEDIWAGTAGGKSVSPAVLAAADEFQVLTDAATIDWNTATQGYKAEVVLGGNRTLGLPSNMRLGRTYTLKIKQPPSGGPRTLIIPAAFKFGAAGTPVLSTAANALDVIRWEVLDLTGPILDARFNKVS